MCFPRFPGNLLPFNVSYRYYNWIIVQTTTEILTYYYPTWRRNRKTWTSLSICLNEENILIIHSHWWYGMLIRKKIIQFVTWIGRHGTAFAPGQYTVAPVIGQLSPMFLVGWFSCSNFWWAWWYQLCWWQQRWYWVHTCWDLWLLQWQRNDSCAYYVIWNSCALVVWAV